MVRDPPPLRRHATNLRYHATRVRQYLTAHSPLILAAIAFLVVTVTANTLFPYHSGNHDEAVYLQQAAMLLEGQLTLHPPVEAAFRPWFFVENADTLYPKYAPVPAAMFAIGVAFGVPRLVLGAVGAAIVVLTYAITRDVFDRRTGLVAGTLLLTSPLFVLNTATFLPYAPTTALNLAFAYAYLRAERDTTRHPNRWAAVAGLATGLAFFARPYTALLFATPFLAHAGWTFLHDTRDAPGTPYDTLTSLRVRRLVTAALGLVGVTLTLAYNWTLTGHPLVFPYEAFAPLDGLGFGTRALLGHELDYTPALALRVNARVVSTYVAQWAPLGILGSVLALGGIVGAWRQDRDWDWRKRILLGVGVSVLLGNVYFWGNYNMLGAIEVPGDGLIALVGPYYHFDLLLPTAAFAGHAIVRTSDAIRRAIDRFSPQTAHRVAVFLLILGLVASAGLTVVAFVEPVSRNAGVTAEYERAYEPFINGDGPPTDAVVFVPEPYGPWLNHPFQYLRNDVGFDGPTVYALQTNQFDVVAEYPGRAYYRYDYRGTWNPFDGSHVVPTLQRVQDVSGDSVTAETTIDLPAGATSMSVRLASVDGHAYYAAPVSSDKTQFTIAVNASHAWMRGPGLEPTSTRAIAIGTRDTVTVAVNVNTEAGSLTYRLELPVATTDGTTRALTPELEVCTVPQLCGGQSAYVPGPGGSPYDIDVRLTARDSANASG